MIEKIFYASVIFIFLGCSNPEPSFNNAQLKKDIKELMDLNRGYKKGEVKPLVYIKQFRLINARIEKQEEYSGYHGHSH